MTKSRLKKTGPALAFLVVCASVALTVPTRAAGPKPVTVSPSRFDPFKTFLVWAEWEPGTGCPTNATVNDGVSSSTYTDTACPTGDPRGDSLNRGIILFKTGPTTNFAAAGATVKNVTGITLNEIGYDIRHGSHCGAGAPRFNILTTTNKFYFLGCASPPPTTIAPGDGFDRLRWGTGTAGSVPAYLNGATLEPITDPIKSISIVFDEAQPTLPTDSTLAILDNVDINGTLIGRP